MKETEKTRAGCDHKNETPYSESGKQMFCKICGNTYFYETAPVNWNFICKKTAEVV